MRSLVDDGTSNEIKYRDWSRYEKSMIDRWLLDECFLKYFEDFFSFFIIPSLMHI